MRNSILTIIKLKKNILRDFVSFLATFCSTKNLEISLNVFFQKISSYAFPGIRLRDSN